MLQKFLHNTCGSINMYTEDGHKKKEKITNIYYKCITYANTFCNKYFRY